MRLMKSILRIGTALSAVCLSAFVCSAAAFAAGTVDPHIAVNAADGETLSVHVAVNEYATDGVVTVSYDPEVLSIASDDVTVTERVAMHSANVARPGTLKLSFIIDDADKTGDIAVLQFTVLKSSSDTGLGLSSQVYDVNENILEEEDVELYIEKEPDKDPSDPEGPGGGTNRPVISTTAAGGTEPPQTSAPATTTGGSDNSGNPDNSGGTAGQPSSSNGSNGNDVTPGKDLIPDTGNAGPVALGIGTAVSLCGVAIGIVAYRRRKH